MYKSLALLLVLFGLAACATGPDYPTTGVDTDLQPVDVAAQPGTYTATGVIWGGLIVATRNLNQYTEIEVLGYPLDSRQRPLTRRTPQGRFLVHQAGYLEQASHAPGRLITVTGTLSENVKGAVGEAPYTYPLVQARALHLWPADTQYDSGRTHFNIGVGVIFGR